MSCCCCWFFFIRLNSEFTINFCFECDSYKSDFIFTTRIWNRFNWNLTKRSFDALGGQDLNLSLTDHSVQNLKIKSKSQFRRLFSFLRLWFIYFTSNLLVIFLFFFLRSRIIDFLKLSRHYSVGVIHKWWNTITRIIDRAAFS